MFALMRLGVFILLAAGVLFAQNGFIYTNDDPSGPNTVSLMAIQDDGSLIKAQSFNTGGTGNGGGGFLAGHRVIVSRDNRFVFASNAGSNDVSGFTIDTTGNLSLIAGSPFSTGGNGCEGIELAAAPDMTFLFAANTCSDNIVVFRIASDGSLALVGTPISTVDAPIDLKVTNNGKFLMVTLDAFSGGLPLSGGVIDVFSIANDGSLTPVAGSPFSDHSPAGAYSSSLDTNCASSLLFVASSSGLPAIDVFNVDTTGSLRQISNSPFAAPGNGVAAMSLSPDERFLYTSNGESATAFAVAADGNLSVVVGTPVAATGTPLLAGLATDSTGRFLYVAGYSANNIAAYTISSQGGLTLEAGSPFRTSGFSGLESLATFPSKSCVSAATVTTLTSSTGASYLRQPLTLTATVTTEQGGSPPDGEVVTFQDLTSAPAIVLGTAPLSGGVATFVTSSLAEGNRLIEAQYFGDGYLVSSTSPSLAQTVTPALVTIAGSPQQPLTQNSVGDYVANVTITNTGNVTVTSLLVTTGGTTLGSGSPLSASASVTNLAPGASAVVTLTFPANSVPPGTTSAPLKVSGAYSVVSPALSGNWALSFRRVTL